MARSPAVRGKSTAGARVQEVMRYRNQTAGGLTGLEAVAMQPIVSLQINAASKEIWGAPDPDRQIRRHLIHSFHQIENGSAAVRIEGQLAVKGLDITIEVTGQIG